MISSYSEVADISQVSRAAELPVVKPSGSKGVLVYQPEEEEEEPVATISEKGLQWL